MSTDRRARPAERKAVRRLRAMGSMRSRATWRRRGVAATALVLAPGLWLSSSPSALRASPAPVAQAASVTPGSGPTAAVWPASCVNLSPTNLEAQVANNPNTAGNTGNTMYGATNVNAQAGNASLTADLSASGTMTVLRSVAANYDNQINYFATGYNPHNGAVVGTRPNGGSFVGLRYQLGSGRAARIGFTWLRDWQHQQAYLSSNSPVPVTDYRSPPGLGLTVVDTDYATAPPLAGLDAALSAHGPDAFVRSFVVHRAPGSPVRRAWLVGYANVSPISSRIAYVPLQDSGCTTQANTTKVGQWRAGHRLATVTWRGIDLLTGKPSAATVALGWTGPTSAHQIGTDSQDKLAEPAPADGYGQLSRAPYRLGGAARAVGQVTVALQRPLQFGRQGTATARLLLTVGRTSSGAVQSLESARAQPTSRQLAALGTAWHTLLQHTRLPATTNVRVLDVAKRSLITMLLAVDPATGAIVASAATQGPYGEDWIRDGSFINAALDANGFQALVTRHNLFYARTQSSPSNPIATVPPGNWPMNMYVTGQPGGPVPYEIDETGYGAWTLASHAWALPVRQRVGYLRQVFPAIARAASWLTICKDPTNGLQCPASEDDTFPPSQTLHGALPDLLGLRSAAAAASLLGHGRDAATWTARANQLQASIDALYSPSAHAYREGPSTGAALPVSFEDGGLLLWPARLHSYSDPRMQGEAIATQASMNASLASTQGSYEAVALLGLCHAWRHTQPARLAGLRSTLRYEASTLTTPTGLFGETWQRWLNGTITPFNDQPHVWEHALFYLSATCLDGTTPYRFGGTAG
ncbi:MAG: hypothetical protein ACYCV7_11580 [Acidimicrobiales bacterium]